VLWRCWLGGGKGIRPELSWCHCDSLSLASVKSRLVFPFWYRLTQVVLDKGPLNVCVCVCVCVTVSLCEQWHWHMDKINSKRCVKSNLAARRNMSRSPSVMASGIQTSVSNDEHCSTMSDGRTSGWYAGKRAYSTQLQIHLHPSRLHGSLVS